MWDHFSAHVLDVKLNLFSMYSLFLDVAKPGFKESLSIGFCRHTSKLLLVSVCLILHCLGAVCIAIINTFGNASWVSFNR